MSISTAGLSAWTDENKMELIHKSVVGATSAGYMTIQTGIKATATINIIDTAVTFADDGCTRTATDSTPLTQVTLTVGAIAIHENLCAKSLNGFYTQTMLGAGSYGGEENVPFEQIYWEHKSSLIAEALEDAIWQGDTTITNNANLDKFDGLIKLIDAGSPVDGNADGVTSGTGITKSNVISILWGMYNAIPEAVLKADDLILFMPLDKFRLYQQAIMEGNLFHYQGEDNQACELDLVGTGLKVVGVPGLSGTNRMFAGRRSNFYIGMDLENEEEQFESWYSQDDRIQKFTTAFKYGTACPFITEAVEFTLV
jgi:hypothetical protein